MSTWDCYTRIDMQLSDHKAIELAHVCTIDTRINKYYTFVKIIHVMIYTYQCGYECWKYGRYWRSTYSRVPDTHCFT